MPLSEDAGDRDTDSTGCHQHLGFKRGKAIASLKINGLRSHHDGIKLLLNDQGFIFLPLMKLSLMLLFQKSLLKFLVISKNAFTGPATAAVLLFT